MGAGSWEHGESQTHSVDNRGWVGEIGLGFCVRVVLLDWSRLSECISMGLRKISIECYSFPSPHWVCTHEMKHKCYSSEKFWYVFFHESFL